MEQTEPRAAYQRTGGAFKGSPHSSSNLASGGINVPCYLLTYAEDGIQPISHVTPIHSL